MWPRALALLSAALAALLAACAPAGPQSWSAPLPSLGAAPPLATENWVNSEPLTLEQLRGKVVLVEFWTFDCYNCRNVIPSLRGWHQRYAKDGLVIIGVHAPEFSYEHDLEAVRDAIARLDVPYPVTQDNDFTTWNRYGNYYWPSLYLVDKRGMIRYSHAGEGAYERTEEAIRALLAEPS
jgi:thiol-disulfide isomerase/thioredoxin